MQMIPGHVFRESVLRLAFRIELNLHSACRMYGIKLNLRSVEPGRFEMPHRFLSQSIVADAASNDAPVSEQRCHVRKIRRSSAELLPMWKHVPEQFSETHDGELLAHGFASSRDCNCSASFNSLSASSARPRSR